jgi:glycosyltransferase involved in cell wall biosynthesis
MADTIKASLTTILDQLDTRFEVVVVDDGSNDHSVAILHAMAATYPQLKVYALPRDRRRKLGLTRNFAITKARGTYVLLHLDCDDLYAPFIIDFTTAFHQIEQAYPHDMLIGGQHINMAKRDFLLSHGPYRNIFRGEDRDLWVRLAAINAFIPFDHVDFVTRLPKKRSQRWYRAIIHTFDHLLNDFRSGMTLATFFYYEGKKWPGMSLALKVFRLLCVLPALIAAQFADPLPLPAAMKSPENFMRYRQLMRGDLNTILARQGHQPDWQKFSNPQAVAIFKNQSTG